MNRGLFVFASALLMPMLASAASFDQANEASLRLGGYGSSTKIKIDSEDEVGTGGVAFGFRYLRNITPRVGVGVDVNSLNLGENESTVLVTNGISTTKLKTVDVLAVVRARFGDGRFQPYVLGGFGLHSTSLKVDSRPQAGLVWANSGTRETRTLVDSDATGAAFALEGGFDYHINNTLSAGAFLGWHFQSEATYDSTAVGRGGGLTSVKGSFAGVALGGSLSARF